MTEGAGGTKGTWNLYGDDRRIASGFDRILIYEFNLLESHRRQVEVLFRDAVDQAQAEWDSAQPINGCYPGEFPHLDMMYEEFREVSELLPRLQWNAQFMVAFATFELCLSKLCGILQTKLGNPVSHRDLQGVGIEQCKAYLLKIGKLNTLIGGAEWRSAWEMKGLRNVIAHANGELKYLPKDVSHVTSKLDGWPGISVLSKVEGAETRLVLSAEFVQHAISIFKNLTIAICNSPLPDKAETPYIKR